MKLGFLCRSMVSERKIRAFIQGPLLLTLAVFMAMSCSFQKEELKTKVKRGKIELPAEIYHKKIHEYGGWSCPDNIFGFPAVDIQELDKIPVVNGRLPTKEETKNGTSLMYFDLAKYPNAKALDMKMPRVARYFSEYTNKHELVVVIQAVAVGQDTVAGFRYANGGNGSGWIEDVDFLTDEEIKKIGSTPFVSEQLEIAASPSKIWEVITNPRYAKITGETFDKGAYIESDWQKDSKVNFMDSNDKVLSTGIVTASWENFYIQVDYNFDGYHYAEKFLIFDNKGQESSTLHVIAGPYGKDYQDQIKVWNNWMNKVKEISESLENAIWDK